MNIYLHVEISARELDSKLLLATLAASKRHQVIVSDLVGIEKGVSSGLLAPGIFHTKSLSPHKDKIARHKKMIDKGFIITSIDEEGNLNDYGYEGFAKTRYSDQTIEQSAAVFGWGSDDVDTLKQTYSKYSHYYTGSSVSFSFLDSPSTTSSTNYALYGQRHASAGVCYFNATGQDINERYARAISTITAMEVSG